MSEAAPAADPSPTSRGPSLLRRIDRALESASDYVNPIFVKETRQSLKSQQFALWYLLLLAGCWVVSIGGLAMIGPAAYYGAFGGQLFLWYAWILAFPLLVVAPFSAYRSLATEQEENTRDVLTVSALTPSQVINGKLASAALQTVVYLSALAPCLGFAYLLRGLDAVTVLLLPALGVLASLGLSLIGLLLASLGRVRYLHVLLNVAFVTTLLVLFYNSFWLLEWLIRDGYRNYQDSDFWVGMAGLLTAYITTFLLAYFLAVACNTFTSANRSTPLRVAMLVQQAAYVGWAAAVTLISREESIPWGAYLAALVYWSVMGMFLTSEAPVLSPRVRRTLPKGLFARQVFTLLTPGPGVGYFFVLANLTMLLGLAFWGMVHAGSGITIGGMGPGAASLLLTCYAAAYLGVGRIIVTVLRGFAELSLFGGFLVHVLLVLAGWSFPYAVAASFSEVRREGFSYLDIPSPIATMVQLERGTLSMNERATIAIVVAGATACVVLINLVLAAREIQQTRLPPPQRILEEELAKRAAASQPTNPWGDTEPVAAGDQA